MENLEVVVNQKVGTISLNFEEIKGKLAVEMESYKLMEFTEDSKKEAKVTLAELRALKKAVDDKRKEVKKAFNKPYDDFEKRVKELIALIDEPIQLIDSKVEKFEQKRIQEKKELIQKIYTDTIGDFAERVPLTSIYKKEWENAGTTKKSIEFDISEVVTSVKTGLDMIKGFSSDCEENAIHQFLNNGFQIAPVISYIQNYENQKKEILAKQEEERKRQEALRIEEEKNKLLEEKVAPVQQEEPEPLKGFIEPEEDVLLPFTDVEETAVHIISIFATDSEMQEVYIALDSIGIAYSKEN